MNKIRLVVALVTLLATASPALALSGHTDWGAWRFDWEVKDGAGVALRNVQYDAELVLYKVSMPVIRVKYEGDQCGPYADRLDVYICSRPPAVLRYASGLIP